MAWLLAKSGLFGHVSSYPMKPQNEYVKVNNSIVKQLKLAEKLMQ